MATIAVIGAGYVGLTTSACFAQLGHRVTCVDVDAEKVRRLNSGQPTIYEPGLEALIATGLDASRLSFETQHRVGLEGAEFVFIAVGTPSSDDGSTPDMRYVYAAVREIGEALKTRALIVNKSTSVIGTGRHLARILEDVNPRLSPWQVVSNPEFLREGSAVSDCLNPSRVVLGATDEESARAVAELYSRLDCPVIITDLNTAEMIKYASNAFLATRVSFINEVARICDALGADVCTVARGMGLDSRIGPEYLQAGIGYGGSCLPKDVAALGHMAGRAGLHPQLLKAVMEINEDQRQWVVQQLGSRLAGLADRTIAIFGLTFKPETDDLRQSPALDVAQRLHAEGAWLRAYDPVVCRTSISDISHYPSPEEAAEGADAVLIASAWTSVVDADWPRIASQMRGRLVFDARNCLDPARIQTLGLEYAGVGRRVAPPATSESPREP